MKEIILATANEHKLREFSAIFGNEVKLLSLKDIGFTKDIIEDGATFMENSLIKCKEIHNTFGKPVIADDSGLCVDALGGAPGILSARYGGKDLGSEGKCKMLISEMDGKEDRDAAFVCALVLYINPNRMFVVQEEFKGKITDRMRGTNGFGYDPVFFLEEYNKTVAELDDEIKNRISHRGKASETMKKILDTIDF